MDILFFNRLEKVGSISMVHLLEALGLENGFSTTLAIRKFSRYWLDSFEAQEKLLQEIVGYGTPSSFTMHRNYINFTLHNLPKPIYINLIRHPLERVTSAFYYRQKIANVNDNNDQFYKRKYTFNECLRANMYPHCNFDAENSFNGDWRRAIMRFCGNERICSKFNSPVALQIAKNNIERNYAVIGSFEETNITLTVLEHYIPKFFRAATDVFYRHPNKFHQNATPHKDTLDDDLKNLMLEKLSNEIELYKFCKQRLFKQYIAIKKYDIF